MLTERMIQSFVTLAETLNYTEAAQQLYLSHQALSKQIARMEDVLGYQLFARSTRSVALTAVGELFYSHFKSETERYAYVCAEAERLARIQQNDLRIGFPLGIRPPEFFGQLVREFDHCTIRMEWHDVDALTTRFEANTLDVVFSLDDSDMAVAPDADRILVAQCRLVLAAAKDNPAWQAGDLSAFSGQTFYYEKQSSPETTNELRRSVVTALREAGIQDARVELIPNQQSRQTAVELGTGCCLSVDLDTLCANPLVHTYPLDRPSTSLSCYWRRRPDKPVVLEFIARFREALEKNKAEQPSAIPEG